MFPTGIPTDAIYKSLAFCGFFLAAGLSVVLWKQNESLTEQEAKVAELHIATFTEMETAFVKNLAKNRSGEEIAAMYENGGFLSKFANVGTGRKFLPLRNKNREEFRQVFVQLDKHLLLTSQAVTSEPSVVHWTDDELTRLRSQWRESWTEQEALWRSVDSYDARMWWAVPGIIVGGILMALGAVMWICRVQRPQDKQLKYQALISEIGYHEKIKKQPVAELQLGAGI